MTLTVSEIFYSIEGETTRAGFPAVFVRLAGCNLRCRYCDTRHAWEGGTAMGIDEIVARVDRYASADHVTVTGGEPLLQGECGALARRLLAAGRAVQIETNGSVSLEAVPAGARSIMDVKTPSSGEAGSFLTDNVRRLRAGDELKFVISSIEDYAFSREFIAANAVPAGVAVNFSANVDEMSFTKLAGMILDDRLPVRLNMQLHTIIWPRGEPVHR